MSHHTSPEISPALEPVAPQRTLPARLRSAAGSLTPVAIAVGVLAAGVWAWWWARESYVQRFGPLDGVVTDARAAWGQFGDFMGGVVNPVLGLLTLLALVATVTLQWRQLQISRAELKATRDELAKTAEAQRQAAQAMAAQLVLAKEQLASAKEEMRRSAAASRIQILSTAIERLSVTVNQDERRDELAKVVSGSPNSGGDYRDVEVMRRTYLKELVALVRDTGATSETPPA